MWKIDAEGKSLVAEVLRDYGTEPWAKEALAKEKPNAKETGTQVEARGSATQELEQGTQTGVHLRNDAKAGVGAEPTPAEAVKTEPVKAKVTPKADVKPKPDNVVPLKDQKVNLLSQIDEAIKNAPEDNSGGKLTFDVPGDGSFTVFNHKATLEQFKDTVQKRWGRGVGEAKPEQAKIATEIGRAHV